MVIVTNLERFKREMEPARQLHACEIREFAKKYDALGNIAMDEFPDIDTQDYIFSFAKVNETGEEELDKIYFEISSHMKEFSKVHVLKSSVSMRVFGYNWGILSKRYVRS